MSFNKNTFVDRNLSKLINPFSSCIYHFLKKLVAGFFLFVTKRYLGDEPDGAIFISTPPSTELPRVTHRGSLMSYLSFLVYEMTSTCREGGDLRSVRCLTQCCRSHGKYLVSGIFMVIFPLPVIIIYLVNDRHNPEIQSQQTLHNPIC